MRFDYSVPVNGRTLNANCVVRPAEGEPQRIGSAGLRTGQVNISLLGGEKAKAGDITTIDYETRMPSQVVQRVVAAERPAGEWNGAELRCEDRVLRFLLNGREVNRVDADRTVVCHPGLQANGTDIRFGNIRLIPSKPSEPSGRTGARR